MARARWGRGVFLLVAGCLACGCLQRNPKYLGADSSGGSTSSSSSAATGTSLVTLGSSGEPVPTAGGQCQFGDDEPNQVASLPTLLPDLMVGEQQRRDGDVGGEDRLDYYRYDGLAADVQPMPTAGVNHPDLFVCIFVQCTAFGVDTQLQACPDVGFERDNGVAGPGCCARQTVSVEFLCGDGPRSATVTMAVEAGDGIPECTPYALAYTF